MAKQTVGFIGLGDMGKPMAARLLEHGYRVLTSAHLRREAIEELKPKGLVEKANPREVAEEVDVLMSIVVDQQQTEHVLRGPDGALESLRPGSTIVIMSTIAPGYCQALAAEQRPRRIDVVDCPVSGARMGAEKGTLALIAGGDAAVIERCRATLETMGKIHHCGPVGMGMVAKLANNAVSLATVSLILEARALGRAYGLDMPTLMGVLRSGTGNSFVAQVWDWVVEQLPVGLPVFLKDLRVCRETAAARGVEMAMLETHLAKDWQQIAASMQGR